jgi:putative transposase
MRYGGLMPSEIWRLKEIEDENSRLNRSDADLLLDKDMGHDILKRKL